MMMFIKTAMILAAGLGERLRPYTLEKPKPLLEVCEKPLIAYALAQLRQAGVKRVAVNGYHLSEQLWAYLATWKDLEIATFEEEVLLGTGGGLKQARDFFGNDPFYVLNADALCVLDLAKMAAVHTQNKALVTLLLKQVDHPEEYGVIYSDDQNQIKGIQKYYEPQNAKHLHKSMFCGIYILEPTVLDILPKGSCSILVAYEHLLKTHQKMMGVMQEGYFLDVGTHERLIQANRDLSQDPILRNWASELFG